MYEIGSTWKVSVRGEKVVVEFRNSIEIVMHLKSRRGI